MNGIGVRQIGILPENWVRANGWWLLLLS